MPAPALPQQKVERLAKAGLSNKEIVERLRREDRIDVTGAAISMFRRRHDLPRARARYADLLPWTVRPEHGNLFMAKMLRTEGQLRAGKELAESTAAQHAAWRRRLEEADAVVHYDGETAEGWWLVPRREGIDKDLIREPGLDDGGKPVRH